MIPKKIIAFGSSSVNGRGDLINGGFARLLRAWHEQKDSKNLFYNLGVAGDTTTGMLKRFLPEAAYRKPDLTILYTGINDASRVGGEEGSCLIEVDRYRKNIFDLVYQAKCLGDVIFTSAFPLDEDQVQPWQNTQYYYYKKDVDLYVDVAREVCLEHSVDYLPIYEDWQNRFSPKDISADGLHANTMAHEMLFRDLKDMITSKYK